MLLHAFDGKQVMARFARNAQALQPLLNLRPARRSLALSEPVFRFLAAPSAEPILLAVGESFLTSCILNTTLSLQ